MSLKLSLLGEQTSLVLVTQGLWCHWNGGLGVGCGRSWAHCAASWEAPPPPPGSRQALGAAESTPTPTCHSGDDREAPALTLAGSVPSRVTLATCRAQAGRRRGVSQGYFKCHPSFLYCLGLQRFQGGLRKQETPPPRPLASTRCPPPRRWSTAGCLPRMASGDGARTPAPLLAGRGHGAELGSVGGGLPAPGATVPQTR